MPETLNLGSNLHFFHREKRFSCAFFIFLGGEFQAIFSLTKKSGAAPPNSTERPIDSPTPTPLLANSIKPPAFFQLRSPSPGVLRVPSLLPRHPAHDRSAPPTSVNRDDSPAHRLRSDFLKARLLDQVDHRLATGKLFNRIAQIIIGLLIARDQGRQVRQNPMQIGPINPP